MDSFLSRKTNNLIALLLLALTLVSCNNTSFNISQGQLGPLSNTTKMNELKAFFPADSLVAINGSSDLETLIGEVEVFNTKGEKLLVISPADDYAQESVIANIRILDPRYTTNKGINALSTFGQIKSSHEIQSIDNAINAVVVYLKDSDLYLTIDKKHLPENIRYDYSSKIEAAQIPNDAPFKYFMIGW
ncbi:MAG: hypothetical protein QNL31_07000 [Flavobacteriaceae bacterium]|jgi:hypothetical protein|tara:strand:- start:3629 stop:4195 length:567 start_codon:yes stop_codon:yes gene_type:complete